MIKSQARNRPVVIRMADKFVDIKALPKSLGLFNSQKNSFGEKIAFRDKVKWIRVDTFGSYKYRESHDDNETWKLVNLQKAASLAESPPIMPEVTLIAIPEQQYPIKHNKLTDIRKQLHLIPDIYRGFYNALSSSSSMINADDIVDTDGDESDSLESPDTGISALNPYSDGLLAQSTPRTCRSTTLNTPLQTRQKKNTLG